MQQDKTTDSLQAATDSQKRMNILNGKSLSKTDYAVLGGTFLLMGIGLYLIYRLQPYFEKLHFERLKTFWGATIINFGLVGAVS